MPVSLEEYDLPSMVGWLIGLHGHDTVRGILGDRFDGLRTGRLNLDEVDMQAREALSQLIEGAILAGMQPPPQPRRTVVPPDAPQGLRTMWWRRIWQSLQEDLQAITPRAHGPAGALEHHALS